MTDIRVGQIWQEVDPRKERFIRVISVVPGIAVSLRQADIGAVIGAVEIETVGSSPLGWFRLPLTRVNHASAARFNGRRGGYKLVEAVA